MGRQATANAIINRVAIQVGLTQDADPVSSSDEAFIQLTGLLTEAGQELVDLHDWQVLRQEYSVVVGTTAAISDGVYALPDDYDHMIDQTAWDNTNDLPLTGPLSPQQWTALVGADLSGSTIYPKFRIVENNFELLPQPPVDGQEVSIEYISRLWARTAGSGVPNLDEISSGDDVVLFEPQVAVKYLKVKFLEAKGFDSTVARLEFENIFLNRTGKDTGAPILRAGRNNYGYPYITAGNAGHTGYGS